MYHSGPSDVNSKQDADLGILSNKKRSKAGQTAARKKKKHQAPLPFQSTKASSIRSIGPDNSGKLRLPLIAIRQQLLLVIQQLLPSLSGVLCIGRLDDSIDRTRFYSTSVIHKHQNTAQTHLDRTRSKCTWSCRYRSGWSSYCHLHAPRPQS